MRLTRARVFLAAGLLAAAATVTTTALAGASASAVSSQVVIVNCGGHGQVRPASYDIGCIANELLAKMSWTSWRATAFGHGDLKINNCIPTCAQGRFISHQVLLVAWRAKPWPHHVGREYFSRLTFIFTAKPPAHGRAAQTITLPATP
jgi:hypothetical protein